MEKLMQRLYSSQSLVIGEGIVIAQRTFLVFLVSLCLMASLHSQDIPITQNSIVQPLIDRLDMKAGFDPEYHSTHKYLTRGELRRLLLRFDTIQQAGYRDREDIQYLVDENLEGEVYACMRNDSTVLNNYLPLWNARPILKTFYKTPANFLQADRKDFYLRLNPVFDFGYGRVSGDDISTTFQNVRGVEMRGGIANRLWFYANLHEVQEAYPAYVNDWVSTMGAVPGAGYLKTYQPSFLKGVTGKDYMNAQGIIGFKIIPQIGLQFGHGRNFIGDGYRSLFLSDFAANYLYLKLNTKLWIFDYQNIYAELNATGQTGGDKLIPKKYFANHHLSLNITPWLNVGLFESVIFSRENHFELQYLNPIIFYRTVEQMVGSPDNAMVGADLKVRLGRSVKLYGQLLLDELVIKNILKQNGWWGNKYGIQAGIQYYDVAGIDHLDMRLEYNMVRPYTYTERDSTSNYTHHFQPLAHPLGANFYETILQLRYAPTSRLVIEPICMYAVTGEDHGDVNNGSNILKPYTTRSGEFGIGLPNGDRANILHAGLDISYMMYHNVFAELSAGYRSKKSAIETYDTKEMWVSIGIRMNMAKRKMLF